MSDRFSEAVKILQAELGFSVVSVWAPGTDDNRDVLAFFMAKDEESLLAAAVELATDGQRAS